MKAQQGSTASAGFRVLVGRSLCPGAMPMNAVKFEVNTLRDWPRGPVILPTASGRCIADISSGACRRIRGQGRRDRAKWEAPERTLLLEPIGFRESGYSSFAQENPSSIGPRRRYARNHY